MAAVSSKQAAAYLLGPLTGVEPSEETGLNSHFVAPTESTPSIRAPVESTSSHRTPSISSNNPYRRSTTTSSSSRPRSAGSYAPSDSKRSPRVQVASLEHRNGEHRHAEHRSSKAPPPYEDPTHLHPGRQGHRRGSSLTARFPGDDSHKPLDLLRKDSKTAHRSPHLRKRGLNGADSIDRLDPTTGIPYHHEGPYDAATLARNAGVAHPPIAALRDSNAEALKATPVERVQDSLRRHVPLDGTAMVPPGEEDRFGRRYDYEQGENMMIAGDPAGGAYKRYPGVVYHPDDIKGKGEPTYSADLARRARGMSLGEGNQHEIEMSLRAPEAEGSGRARSGSFKDGLKKRMGGIRRSFHEE